MTEIDDKHMSLGGSEGFLGLPIEEEQPVAGGGRKRDYERGSIYWSLATGAHEVHGQIRDRWRHLGAELVVGYPQTDELSTQPPGFRYSDFEHGSIYWTARTGPCEILGAIRTRWRSLGGGQSLLGYPLTGERQTPDGSSSYNAFEGGSIYASRHGVFECLGLARERWLELGGTAGRLGPVADTPFEATGFAMLPWTVCTFWGGWIEVDQPLESACTTLRPTREFPNLHVTVRFYRVAEDNGNAPCPIDPAGLVAWVREANDIFGAAGIRLSCDDRFDIVRNTDLVTSVGVESPGWTEIKSMGDALAQQSRSIVVLVRAGAGNGYSWSDYDFIVMPAFASYTEFGEHGGWLFAHELGHFLGLPHTHSEIFATIRSLADRVLSGYELVDNDAAVVGDTPAEAFVEEIKFDPLITSIRVGSATVAVLRENVMSYWTRAGLGARGRTAHLTPGQIAVVRQTLAARGDRYLELSRSYRPSSCASLRSALTQAEAALAVAQARPRNHDNAIRLALAESDLHDIQRHLLRSRCPLP